MPTPTDLVTDLPADFEVFGQAVDTSMADLKGGTSGQVLSKNSNTDMDFVWVTSDDANAIQNSIVNAKGDIIGASANDTPAITSVGANDTMLVADSTAATGLAYKSATTLYPWAAYTPSASNISVGNGTLTARYQQIGKLVNVEIFFTLGSTSTVTGLPTFAIPVSAKSAGFTVIGVAGFGDSGVGTFVATPIVYSTTVYLAMIGTGATYAKEDGNVNSTTPFTWTTNDTMIARFTYEAA